jgi:ion channel-forming bestrophin family protein
MIVKRNFNPIKVASYVWREVTLGAGMGVAVYLVYEPLNLTQIGLSFAPLGVLGTALSIFLAFRASSAFARWNEAAQVWANIVNGSRIFARLIITFTDSHAHTPVYDANRAAAFKQEMIYRHLAWVNTLRLTLRGQEEWEEVRPFLAPAEQTALDNAANKPHALLKMQGNAIYSAMANGTLQGFDSFQLEGQLAALSAAQATSERLKHIPIPRQYDYFTRLFVRIFVVITPFFLVKTLAADGLAWLVIPLAALVAFLFTTIERTAAVNEEPFENRITDVPLTALCRDIERDLREMLGETALPAKSEPQGGYLW